jgi:hypothetical protein
LREIAWVLARRHIVVLYLFESRTWFLPHAQYEQHGGFSR